MSGVILHVFVFKLAPATSARYNIYDMAYRTPVIDLYLWKTKLG